MNYWHMQLHRNDKNCGIEKELLEELAFIGLGDWKDGRGQIDNFKNTMRIDDIVLIRKGEQAIALVQIVGDIKDVEDDQGGRLDWMKYRRKVKVLDSDTIKMEKFPQARGTLQRLIDKKTKSYQYIHNWYMKIIQEQYRDKDLIDGSYKLKELYIEKFKMFNKLKIDFTDKDRNILPLIVISGKNGTGKTTLLEYLANIKVVDNDYIEISKIRGAEGLEEFENDDDLIVDNFRLMDGQLGIKAKKDEYKKHIIYLSVEINKIDNIEKAIVNYYLNIGEAKDLRPSEIMSELQKFMNNIFNEDFDLSFKIARVDTITRQVFFKNHNNIEVSIDDLSTGEKTLLSKVLYLHFKDIKNQIILIDEPELSLHPAWQNRVLKLYENFAKGNNCQIIIATHSPHIIGSAKSEYIRLLTEDGIVDNFSNTYGAKVSQILTEVMDVELRDSDINKKLLVIKKMIVNNEFDSDNFILKWEELENTLGKNYFDLGLLKVEIASRRKNVQNSKR